MDPDLAAFYESLRDTNRESYEIVDHVRTLILNQAPQVTESLHSDRVIFTVNGTHSFFVRPQEEYVAIGFVNNGEIPNSTNFLSGNDRTCRIVKVTALDDVQSSGFRMLIENPSQISNSNRQ